MSRLPPPSGFREYAFFKKKRRQKSKAGALDSSFQAFFPLKKEKTAEEKSLSFRLRMKIREKNGRFVRCFADWTNMKGSLAFVLPIDGNKSV